jgi:hypothetical protein
MRELLSIADRIEDISREIPVSSFAGFLEGANRKIRKIASNDAFYIDVYRSEVSSAASKKLNKVLDEAVVSTNFVLVHKDEKNFDVRVFEHIFPSIALIYLDEELMLSGPLKQHIRNFDTQYKLVIVVNLLPEGTTNQEFNRLLSYRLKVINVLPEDFEGKTFTEILRAHLQGPVLDGLHKISYLNSIKPVFTFLDDVITAENKAAGTRKLLNNQNVNITRKEEQFANLNDLSGALRQITQRDIQELEKSYKTKYDDLNKPNIGMFSVKLKVAVDDLVDFEVQKVAEKSEKVDITINQDFQKDFVANIRTDLSNEYVKDESFVKTSIEELLKKVNIQLKNKGVAPVKPIDIYPQFPESKRVLDSYCYISREYKGELIKRGPTEYFVALRDYTGIIMVAVGLLGPLNGITMLQDFFDKDKNADTAAFSVISFFKGFNASIKIITAVITLGMICYGIIDLRKRIPRRRIEEFNREMVKAKETLGQEGKRIYNEASRDWLQNISMWIKDVNQNLALQIEKNIKNTQLARVNQANQEKKQQQKQLQIIDVLLNSIQSAGRIKDQMSTRYRDMVSDLEKNLKF